MYEVMLESHAERDLRKLPSQDFSRVIAALQTLANNPRAVGCRKIVGSHNDWRIRVGDYRVLYEISDHERTVRIMRVKHRKEAYR